MKGHVAQLECPAATTKDPPIAKVGRPDASAEIDGQNMVLPRYAAGASLAEQLLRHVPFEDHGLIERRREVGREAQPAVRARWRRAPPCRNHGQ